MKDFRTLQVWQKSHDYTLEIYRTTKIFPNEEKYGLTSQIHRSASSIPTNIAERCGYKSDKELRRFLQIAMGSASETEYSLLLAKDLSLLDERPYQELNKEITEIKKNANLIYQKTLLIGN